MAEIDADEIRKRSYELWQQAGYPSGQQDAFWFEAERQLIDEAIARTPEIAVIDDIIKPLIP